MKGHQRKLEQAGVRYSLQKICFKNPRDPRCIWGIGHQVPDHGGGGSGAGRALPLGRAPISVRPAEQKGSENIVPPPLPGGKTKVVDEGKRSLPERKPPMQESGRLPERPGAARISLPRRGPEDGAPRPVTVDEGSRTAGLRSYQEGGLPARGGPRLTTARPMEPPTPAEAPRPPLGSSAPARPGGAPELPRGVRPSPPSGEMRPIGEGPYTEAQLAPLRPSQFESEGGLLDASDRVWNRALPDYSAFRRGIPTEGYFPRVTTSGELVQPTRSMLHMAGRDIAPPRIGRTFTPPENGLQTMRGANWFGKKWGKPSAPEPEPAQFGLEAPGLGEQAGGTVSRMLASGDETGLLQRLQARAGMGRGAAATGADRPIPDSALEGEGTEMQAAGDITAGAEAAGAEAAGAAGAEALGATAVEDIAMFALL